MASSPPKPYEMSNSSSSSSMKPLSTTPPPAITSTNHAGAANANSTALVPAGSFNPAGTELTPHSLPNGFSSSSTTDLSTVNPNSAVTPMNSGYGSALSNYSSPYSRYGYGSGYGGYGSYGMGMSYGMGGGMSPYGMSGMNGMGMGMGTGMGPNAYGKMVNGGMSLINGFESSVNTFGRISALLQMNFEALAMSFSSVLRLFDHVSMLKHEMYGVVQTFTTLKFLHYVYIKFRKMLSFVGVPQVADMNFHEVWQEAPKEMIRGPNGEILQQAQQHGNSAWLWLPLTIMAYLMWNLVKWIYRKIRAAYSPVDHEAMAKEFAGSQATPNGTATGNPQNPAANGTTPNGVNPANPNQVQLGPDGRPIMNGMMNNGVGLGTGPYGAGGYSGYGGMSPYSSYGMNSGYGNYGNYGSMYGNSMYGSSYSPYSSYGNSAYGAGGGYGYGNGYGNGYGGSPYM